MKRMLILGGVIVALATIAICFKRQLIIGPYSASNMNAILLADPLVLAQFHWDGTGNPPSNSQCLDISNVLGASVKSAGWTFKAPKSVDEPGRIVFKHGPSNLEWIGIVELETDTINEPGILTWVVRCVQPNGPASDAHTEANFKWAWNDLGGNFAAALATSTNALGQRQWRLVRP